MSNESEQIEARLAAYIDGVLPDDQRAEIERYLTANPSHRSLIEDLRRQSKLVSSLPRVKAPAEVMDHLQSHLERSELLQDVEQAATSMRINRSPQILAIAAVALLAVGLAVLVVQILPSPNQPRQVVLAPPTPPQLPPSVGDEKSLSQEILKEQAGWATADSLGRRRDDAVKTLADKDNAEGTRSAVSKQSDELSKNREAVAGLAAPGGPGGFGGAGHGAADGAAEGAGANVVSNANPGGGAGGGAVPGRDDQRLVDAASKDLAPLPAVNAPKLELPSKDEISSQPLSNTGAILVQTDDPTITQNLVVQYLNANGYSWHIVPDSVAGENAAKEKINLDDRLKVADGAPRLQSQVQIVRDLTANANVNANVSSSVELGQKKLEAGASSQQVIVVRNLTPQQALVINGSLNEQRNGRQRATYFGNSALNTLAQNAGGSVETGTYSQAHNEQARDTFAMTANNAAPMAAEGKSSAGALTQTGTRAEWNGANQAAQPTINAPQNQLATPAPGNLNAANSANVAGNPTIASGSSTAAGRAVTETTSTSAKPAADSESQPNRGPVERGVIDRSAIDRNAIGSTPSKTPSTTLPSAVATTLPTDAPTDVVIIVQTQVVPPAPTTAPTTAPAVPTTLPATSPVTPAPMAPGVVIPAPATEPTH